MEWIGSFQDYQDQLDILLNVLIAILLAGIVGFERERAQKPSGFRTNMLIGGSAALLIALGKVIVHDYEEGLVTDALRTDPIRVFEAIVVGVSFIGAGTILKARNEQSIYYLTTAATILFSAVIGICVGLEKYVLAVGVTIVVLLINLVIRKLNRLIVLRKKEGEEEEDKE